MNGVYKVHGYPIYRITIWSMFFFYACSLILFLTYFITRDIFWFRIGCISNFTGVLLGILNVSIEILDWWGIDRSWKRTGFRQMLFNILALFFFITNLSLQTGKWNSPMPDIMSGFFLIICGLLCWSVSMYFSMTELKKEEEAITYTW